MVYGAIDLHLRFSQIRVIDGDGKVLRESRVVTSAERLVAAFAGLGPVRVLVESSTESEWVATALEGARYDVVVADPNFAPMYGDVRRSIKTDRRDVQALAEANRHGWFRAVYRCSPAQRAQRQVLTTRRQLVRMRSGTISVMRALLRQQGYRVSAGSSERFGQRVGRLAVSDELAATIAPLVRTVEALTTEIRALDSQLASVAATDPIVQRLQTVPGVGPTVAVTFRAFVDDVARFPSAHI